MVDEFKQMLVTQGAKVDEASFEDRCGVHSRPRSVEVDGELFGAEESRRNMTRVDPQAQAGARVLLTRPRSCSRPKG
jgi:hypothetical protein